MSFGKHNQKNLNLLAYILACQSRRLVGFGAFAMKHISLTQGRFAIIDDEDYDIIVCLRWHAHKITNGHRIYGFRAVHSCHCPFTKKNHLIYMHRLIMQCPTGKEVDHVDHDPLNNQKANLRICTHAENVANGTSRRGSSSKYKGVSWLKARKKWTAQIGLNNKVVHLGCFTDEVDAATAYDKVATEQFGEFARTNF